VRFLHPLTQSRVEIPCHRPRRQVVDARLLQLYGESGVQDVSLRRVDARERVVAEVREHEELRPDGKYPTRRERALRQFGEAFFPAQRVKARYQPAMAQAQQFAVQLQPVIVLARGHLVPIQYRTLEGLRVGRGGDAFTCGEIAEFRKVRELRAASSDDLVAEFGVEIAEK